MYEWMKRLLIYLLSSGHWPDLKAVYSTYHRLTDGLPTWIEQSNDSLSTSSFHIIIYSGAFISFLSLSSIFLFFHYPHIFIFIITVRAGYLYVTDTLSTPAITEPPSVECQELLILSQIKCMCGQNWPRCIVPSERLYVIVIVSSDDIGLEYCMYTYHQRCTKLRHWLYRLGNTLHSFQGTGDLRAL